MARSLLLKARIRGGGSRRARAYRIGNKAGRGKLETELDKLEKEEEILQASTNRVMDELERIEETEHINHKPGKHEFAWIKGKLTILTLQDFVGAAFGAIFFVVTQEVWELSARLSAVNAALVALVSFTVCFLLVYLSRRRKYLSMQLHHTAIFRSVEVYAISLATSLLFIIMFNTASGFVPVLKQAIVVTFPAVISAATADLLFF